MLGWFPRQPEDEKHHQCNHGKRVRQSLFQHWEQLATNHTIQITPQKDAWDNQEPEPEPESELFIFEKRDRREVWDQNIYSSH